MVIDDQLSTKSLFSSKNAHYFSTWLARLNKFYNVESLSDRITNETPKLSKFCKDLYRFTPAENRIPSPALQNGCNNPMSHSVMVRGDKDKYMQKMIKFI